MILASLRALFWLVVGLLALLSLLVLLAVLWVTDEAVDLIVGTLSHED